MTRKLLRKHTYAEYSCYGVRYQHVLKGISPERFAGKMQALCNTVHFFRLGRLPVIRMINYGITD